MQVQGGLGGIYAYATYTASTISFHENTPSADTIEDSANGFLTAGFVVGMIIAITDTALNNKSVTIAGVTAGILTLLATDDLADEAEGNATLATPAYGTQLIGFRQWGGVDGAEVVEKTTFENYPFKRFAITIKNWTADFNGFWLSIERDSWLGRTLHLRLFQRFALVPSASDMAIFWSGDGIIGDIPLGVPVDALVNQSFSVQGDGVLTKTYKTDAW